MECAQIKRQLMASLNVSEIANHQQPSIHVSFISHIGNMSTKIVFIIPLETGTHDSKCACCRAVDYDSLEVELECEDGFTLKKKVAVPKVCGCEDGCLGPEPEPQKRSYKSSAKKYDVKTG